MARFVATSHDTAGSGNLMIAESDVSATDSVLTNQVSARSIAIKMSHINNVLCCSFEFLISEFFVQ